jgi:hypothetical protein
LAAGNRVPDAGCCLLRTSAEVLLLSFGNPLAPETASSGQNLTRIALQTVPAFSHEWKMKNRHSPLFGILALKRLSSLRASHLSLSRETFNASCRTIVKPLWWEITRLRAPISPP